MSGRRTASAAAACVAASVLGLTACSRDDASTGADARPTVTVTATQVIKASPSAAETTLDTRAEVASKRKYLLGLVRSDIGAFESEFSKSGASGLVAFAQQLRTDAVGALLYPPSESPQRDYYVQALADMTALLPAIQNASEGTVKQLLSEIRSLIRLWRSETW